MSDYQSAAQIADDINMDVEYSDLDNVRRRSTT
jgi:hypothetical protein